MAGLDPAIVRIIDRDAFCARAGSVGDDGPFKPGYDGTFLPGAQRRTNLVRASSGEFVRRRDRGCFGAAVLSITCGRNAHSQPKPRASIFSATSTITGTNNRLSHTFDSLVSVIAPMVAPSNTPRATGAAIAGSMSPR